MAKIIPSKKPAKDQREKLVLLGLVELYLKTGNPIGSNTLRENGFESLSSATIRNYFGKLEHAGYLKQQHSSGGRIPTQLAYKLYADTYLPTITVNEKDREWLQFKMLRESREPATYLQQMAEIASEMTNCAVFLSSPRFDQDFVLDIKLVGIDQNRCLCVLITDFGLIHTEVLFAEKKLSNFSIKRIEAYLHWRITGLDKPELNAEEETLASRFYKEVMLRHIVNHSNFSAIDVYKTGFSKLLSYPDFNNAAALASGLSLFENEKDLRALLNECVNANHVCCWIGDDLADYATTTSGCSVIAIPYRINQTTAGAIAILGPHRIPYRRLFGLLKTASEFITESLTKSMYKFKISFRQPQPAHLEFNGKQMHFVNESQHLLLEDKT
jgi:heat-inducible transcriptional repressor